MQMIKKPVITVIVPRDKQMTELTEFASLKSERLRRAGPARRSTAASGRTCAASAT